MRARRNKIRPPRRQPSADRQFADCGFRVFFNRGFIATDAGCDRVEGIDKIHLERGAEQFVAELIKRLFQRLSVLLAEILHESRAQIQAISASRRDRAKNVRLIGIQNVRRQVEVRRKRKGLFSAALAALMSQSVVHEDRVNEAGAEAVRNRSAGPEKRRSNRVVAYSEGNGVEISHD